MKFNWINFLKDRGVFLLLTFVLFFLVYDVSNILSVRPTSIHVWRQTDCASLAYMYHAKDLPFLKPEMHNYISDGGTSGRTAGEFPGLYWAVGKLYNIFGFHESIYRLVGLLLFIAGLYAVYVTVSSILRDRVWGYIVAGFLATSPVLVFYSSAFLTNVPALSLTLIAWAFAWKYYEKRRLLFLVSALLCFALAGLLKVTALVSFLAFFAWWFVEQIKFLNRYMGAPLSKLNIFHGLSFAFVLAIVYAWYAYADSYIDGKLGKYTFNDVWPLWKMNQEAIDKAVSFATEIIIFQVTSPLWQVIILLAAAIFLVFGLMRFKYFALFLLTLAIGSSLYLMLWFNALDGHDYYVINLLILPAFLLLGLGITLKNYILSNHFIKWVLVLALIWNVGYARNNFQMRYWPEFGKTVENSKRFGDEKLEVGFWRYFGEHRDYDVYHNLEQQLQKWGVSKQAVVISLPDPSFCISLYLMNREGFSNMSCPMTAEAIQERIDIGAEYLVVQDSMLKDQRFLEPFQTNKVGSYKTVSVYDLTRFKQ